MLIRRTIKVGSAASVLSAKAVRTVALFWGAVPVGLANISPISARTIDANFCINVAVAIDRARKHAGVVKAALTWQAVIRGPATVQAAPC